MSTEDREQRPKQDSQRPGDGARSMEHRVGDVQVLLVEDEGNERAWIQSTTFHCLDEMA